MMAVKSAWHTKGSKRGAYEDMKGAAEESNCGVRGAGARVWGEVAFGGRIHSTGFANSSGICTMKGGRGL